jgi:aminoglycoside phosphotransferase (APT) family kinase protein
MSEWAAELYVGVELARELIREQFAPLPRRSVELLSTGWDYVVYRVDEEWVFRFPRRGVVVPGTERELAILPRLGELLPVPVSAPVHVGRAGARFPWPFYGACFLPGVEAGEAGLGDDARVGLAALLGRALRRLHSSDTLAVVGSALPIDPIRRADMAFRVPRTREVLDAVSGLWSEPPLVDAILERARRLPPLEATAVCHGDLHFRQLLVDGDELSGIIDWIDVCRSDPGVDLQLLWSFLPPDGRGAFLDEYGPVSDESLLRARVLALFLNAILARYGHVQGLASVEEEALAGLRRAASDEV